MALTRFSQQWSHTLIFYTQVSSCLLQRWYRWSSRTAFCKLIGLHSVMMFLFCYRQLEVRKWTVRVMWQENSHRVKTCIILYYLLNYFAHWHRLRLDLIKKLIKMPIYLFLFNCKPKAKSNPDWQSVSYILNSIILTHSILNNQGHGFNIPLCSSDYTLAYYEVWWSVQSVNTTLDLMLAFRWNRVWWCPLDLPDSSPRSTSASNICTSDSPLL